MRVKWNRNLDVPVPQRAQTTANTDKYEKRRGFFQFFKFRDKKDEKSNKDNEKGSTISSSKTTTKVRKTVTFAESSMPQIVVCNRKGRRVATDQVDMSVFKVISNSEPSKSSIQDSKESPLFKKRPESEFCKSVATHMAVYNRHDSQKEMCAGKILKSSGDRFTFRKDKTGILPSWDSYKPDNMSSNSSASQTRITSNGLKIHADFKVDNDEIHNKLIAQKERLKVSRIPVAVGAVKRENYYGYNGEDTKNMNLDYSENEYLNYQCKQEKTERIIQSKLSTVGKVDEKVCPDKIGNDRAMSKVILTHKNARYENIKKKTFTEVEKKCDDVPFGRTCSIPKVIPTDVLKLYNYDFSNNDNEKVNLIEIDEKSNVEETVNDKACKKSRLSQFLDDDDKNINNTNYGIFPSANDFHAEPVFIDDAVTDDFYAGIDDAQNVFCSAENSKKLLMKTECSSLRSATNIAASNDLGGCQGQIKFACFTETAGAIEKESSDEIKCWINPIIDLNTKNQESRKFSFDTTTAFIKNTENKCWMETCVSSQLIPPTTKLKAEHVFIDDDDDDEFDLNIKKFSEKKILSEVNASSLQPISSLKKIFKNSEPNKSTGILCDVNDLVSNSSKIGSFDDRIFSDDTKEFSVEITKNNDSFSEVIKPVGEVLFIDDEPKMMAANTSKNLGTKLVNQQKSVDVVLKLPIYEAYTKQKEELSKNEKIVQKVPQEYAKEMKYISKNHHKQTEHAFEDYPKQVVGFTTGSSITNEKIENNQKEDLLSSFKPNEALLVENNQIDRDNTGHINNLLAINKMNEKEINNSNCEISEESNAKHMFTVYDKTISSPTNIARSENILKTKQNLADHHSINIDTKAELAAAISSEKLITADLKTKLLIDDVSEVKTSQNFTQYKKQDLNFMNCQGIITRNLTDKDNSIFKVVDTQSSGIDTIEVSLCKNPNEENMHDKETCNSAAILNTEIIECVTTHQLSKLSSQNLKDRNLTSSVTSKSNKCELDDINKNCELIIINYSNSTFKDNYNIQDFINQKSNESGQLFQCKHFFSNWKNLTLPIQITLKYAIDPSDFQMKENNGRKMTMDNDLYKNQIVIASENSSLPTRIPNVWEESGSQDKNSPEIGYMKLTGLDGGRLLVQLNRLFRDVNERPVKFEELVQCQKGLDILSLLYGKHVKQPQLSIKGNVQNSKQQPPVWTTRVELAKEIQRLGTLCEARTKELTHLKMQLKHASLGFDTFVVLFQYLTEELDAFSHTHIVSELERTKEALIRAEEQLQQYKNEFEELKVKHSTEFSELTDKLNRTYQEVIEELTCKYTTEIQELKCLHEQQLAEMSENHMKQYQEAKEKHTMSLIDLETSHQQQIQDMKKIHAEELEEIEYNHQQARLLLRNQLKELEHQCKDLKHQAKLVEEALQRDTDTKIQWISAKKADLEKEVDSLKTVLDMKRNEIHALRKENLEMKKELEKLPAAKEKIKMLQAKAEDLQAMVDEKVQKERQLSCDHESLKESYEKESKVNKRLSMENEELLWKLKQTAEANFMNSLSGSPEVFEKLFSPLKSPNKQSVSLPPMFFHSIDESFASAKETVSPNTSNSKNGCKKPPLSPRKCSSPVRTPSFVAASPAAPCSRRCKTEVKSPRKQKQKFQNTTKNKSLTENLTSDSTNSDESIIGAKSIPNRDVNYASMVQNGIHDDGGGEIYSCSLEKVRGCDELMFEQNKESSECKLLNFENFTEQEKPKAFKFELENLTTGNISSNNGHFPLTYCQQMISSFSEEESSNSSSSKNCFLFDEHHFGEKGPFDFNHSLIQREGWAISSPRNHAGEAMIHNLSQVSDESGQFGTSTGQTTKMKSTHLQENEQNGHHLESFTMDMPDSNNLDTSCEDLLSEPEQIS